MLGLFACLPALLMAQQNTFNYHPSNTHTHILLCVCVCVHCAAQLSTQWQSKQPNQLELFTGNSTLLSPPSLHSLRVLSLPLVPLAMLLIAKKQTSNNRNSNNNNNNSNAHAQVETVFYFVCVCLCSGFALSTRRLTDTRNKFTKKVGLN